MKHGWLWIMAAWGVALVATLGALFIGEGMRMTPCLFCWNLRIFMFPLVLGGAAMAGYYTVLVAGWVPKWWVPRGKRPVESPAALTRKEWLEFVT